MSQVELIWGAFSLMFLGAMVSMCMKCQRTGGRQEETGLDSQRNQYADRQSFEAVRSCSMSRQDYPKILCDMPGGSKRSKHPALASHLQTCPEPRYQNTEKVLPEEQDPAYVEAVATDLYYNCRRFSRQSSDDGTYSYQNMPGPPMSSGLDVDIYENSTTIQIWKHSQITEDSEDDEPDYINSGPICSLQGKFNFYRLEERVDGYLATEAARLQRSVVSIISEAPAVYKVYAQQLWGKKTGPLMAQ